MLYPHLVDETAGIDRYDGCYCQWRSAYMGSSSEYLPESSEHSGAAENGRDAYGRLLSPHLDAPIVDDLGLLDETFRSTLEKQAEEPREKAKLDPARMEAVLLSLCQGQYLTLSVLAQLVNRNPDGLRQQYLSKMVRAESMALAFPTKPTHEKQAYRAVENTETGSKPA